MRNIIILIGLGIAASMAGWFTIDRDGKNTTITFDRDEIRSDTKKVIDRGREYLKDRYAEDGSSDVDTSQPPQLQFPLQGSEYGEGYGSNYPPQDGPGQNASYQAGYPQQQYPTNNGYPQPMPQPGNYQPANPNQPNAQLNFNYGAPAGNGYGGAAPRY